MPSLASFKLVSALVTLGIAWAGVLLPVVLRRSLATLSLARMLSVGVMLGGGLLHLLPDAASDFSSFEFPLAYFLFACGLLAPLTVETLLLDADSPTELPDSAESSLCCPTRTKSDTFTPMETDDADAPDERAAFGSSSGTRHQPRLASAAVLLLALSFHSVLEGLAQGTARSLESGLVLLVAIAAHKGLAALALGCTFLDAQLSLRASAGLGLLFALATPAGVLVGALLPAEGAEGTLTAAGLTAMAGGSFTFVALLEVLPRELHAPHGHAHGHARAAGGVSRLSKLGMLALGFVAMAGLAVVV